MQQVDVTKDDLSITIQADTSISFDWSASYISSTVLSVDLSISQVLVGNEILTLKFINYKIFRGPYGG